MQLYPEGRKVRGWTKTNRTGFCQRCRLQGVGVGVGSPSIREAQNTPTRFQICLLLGQNGRGGVCSFSIGWTSDCVHTAENELFPAGVWSFILHRTHDLRQQEGVGTLPELRSCKFRDQGVGPCHTFAYKVPESLSLPPLTSP